MKVTWLITILVFLLDYLIKNYLRLNFSFQSLPIIKNIFHITIVFNEGAAFGMLRGKTHLLIVIGIIFLSIFYLILKSEKNKSLLFFAASGMIFGGAISNLYDRIVLGFVVDYLDFRIWPVFNLSDTCISVGAGLLILQSIHKHKKNPN
ncbi:MAG: signal peptidase II [Candidatus Omnitrophica bacterium]|nr:signal peptidase II [Candidatus Omnitrophota bacterium]